MSTPDPSGISVSGSRLGESRHSVEPPTHWPTAVAFDNASPRKRTNISCTDAPEYVHDTARYLSVRHGY